jgi:hypothetical protein
MLKLLKTATDHRLEDPEISILDLSDFRDGLEKKAAHSDITKFVQTLAPKEGYTYLHINAMTAGEYHGSNRNADFFPEDNLRQHYKTFETSPAYVYRSHINKDPNRSYGKVIFSVYNEYMHRIELIAECPNELVDDINKRIKAGDFPTTSMACKTPWDTCSICGNKAKSRQEYCSHLSTQLGKLYPDGRKVYAINDAPLHFFDISIVVRPADVNSSILQKVANEDTIGSAELAELEGLTEKQFQEKSAELKKWSEFIKEISDGHVVDAVQDPADLLSKTRDLPFHTIEQLHGFDLNETLTAFAHMGISPSVEYLSELVARKSLGEGYEGIGALVEEFIHGVGEESLVPVQRYHEPDEVNPVIYSAIAPYVMGSSLFPDVIEKRASGIGYAGLGPHIEPTPEELKISQQHIQAANTLTQSYGKVLLGLGVAALLAKYYISHQIEKKLNSEKYEIPKNNVKIVIIKKASDYMVAANLSRSSLHRSMPRPPASQAEASSNATHTAMVNKVVRRILKRTKSSVGRKLAGILRLVGFGAKASDNIL